MIGGGEEGGEKTGKGGADGSYSSEKEGKSLSPAQRLAR